MGNISLDEGSAELNSGMTVEKAIISLDVGSPELKSGMLLERCIISLEVEVRSTKLGSKASKVVDMKTCVDVTATSVVAELVSVITVVVPGNGKGIRNYR
ncbi:hypothetical protein RRG08_039721 [Elysia crispata]|uniref:Uncharacterized protein n=1 Tax=Elysia crispata TaxID=231223 RepID=A0AAE0YAA3_9GAST|nr:hypothetical protein RRG08_039721 [Elysia crispata]